MDDTEPVETKEAPQIVIQQKEEQYKTLTTDFINPVEFQQMMWMAQNLQEAKALPVSFQNGLQLVMAFQAGREMGIGPMESLRSFYMVNGQLNIWGAAVTKRLKQHGWDIAYIDEDNSCTATVRKGDLTYTETYNFEDAEKSAYTKTNAGQLKIGWLPGINRKLKLRYGSLSVIIRSYLPEVLGSAQDIVEIAQDYTKIAEDKQNLEDELAELKSKGDVLKTITPKPIRREPK